MKTRPFYRSRVDGNRPTPDDYSTPAPRRGQPLTEEDLAEFNGSVRRAAKEPPVTKGECRECGKWLPGERSLCGRCSVTTGRT